MPRKTIEVDCDMIDRSQDELSKLMIWLEKIPRYPGRTKIRLRKFKKSEIQYRIRFYMQN